MKAKKAIEPIPETRLSHLENNIFLSLCCLIVAGIYYSTALVTLSMAGLFILSLRHFSIQKTRLFFSDYTLFPFMLLFLLVFLSGGNSEDRDLWRTAVLIKLPFLLLPIAIYMLPRCSKSIIIQLHIWLLIAASVVGIPVLFHALVYHQDMLKLLSKGQHIPTPIEAVKYSMFNAYSVITGILLLSERSQELKEKTAYQFTIVATIFLFVLMHVLAVRTGLVILYMSLLIFVITYIRRTRAQLKKYVLISGLLALPIVLWLTLPSLLHKTGYMLYDFRQQEQGNYYSDSERIMSYEAGWSLWKKAPVMGVGYGDVRAASNDYYIANFDRSDLYKLPHSQFLLTMAGGGLLGLLMFIAGFYTPILQFRKPHLFKALLFFLYLNYTLSFLVENSLERSMSVAFFLVFSLILIKGLNDERTRSNSLS